ncbi:alkaline phosphatase [Polaribacter sp. BM10]|uniref:alkaline phosphatase D family protein n=1 Tax=Polaribacter sp. BM10 TaxID=1529069 RepID=UPI00098AFF1B|nr:alkaline phosphatase D family protein [Polaribacter sp. BM10]AQS93326.1 alkaline phosphatase [Polaribacter sp. BM10]
MKLIIKYYYFICAFFIFSCTSTGTIIENEANDFTIAFGSCNKQYVENLLWKEIKKNKPNLWIWGGDNIYADTHNLVKLKEDYATQKNQKGYLDLVKNIPVMATWDDHDYGINDSGEESPNKVEAQKAFLDFFNVDANDSRRNQKGIYHTETFKTAKGTIKVFTLDTRYFRTALTDDNETKKRYKPNTYGKGTVLGDQQWDWLTKELKNSNADFNIIVSSIQVLSQEHGYETWGNFPHEVDKLKQIITNSKAKGVLLLSGDRHISEFSKIEVKDLNYPLIDFTSSGLTHSYKNFSGEKNKNRVLNVVSEISYGLLKFDFDTHKITMEMRGKNNKLLQELYQIYP